MEENAINWELIDRRIEEGYIRANLHPSGKLKILNYTQKTQFEWVWDEATINCRGLIVDLENNIVARPFKKFFGIEQVDSIPSEPFAVNEKMDGSLGILYWLDNKPAIATRGSFESEQAKYGTKLFRERYSDLLFDRSLTYLFEIIYPENRIVVDYDDRRDLVFLCAIDNGTGVDVQTPFIDIPRPRLYAFDSEMSPANLQSLNTQNEEGFVLIFESGVRLKVKFDDYKRLHKLLTGVSEKSIWEILSQGQGLEAIIEHVPDEFFNWVKQIEQKMISSYQKIENIARSEMKRFPNRKEAAIYFQTCSYPAIMFAMLDNKRYDKIIWKMVRPKSSDVFKLTSHFQ